MLKFPFHICIGYVRGENFLYDIFGAHCVICCIDKPFCCEIKRIGGSNTVTAGMRPFKVFYAWDSVSWIAYSTYTRDDVYNNTFSKTQYSSFKRVLLAHLTRRPLAWAAVTARVATIAVCPTVWWNKFCHAPKEAIIIALETIEVKCNPESRDAFLGLPTALLMR